MNVLKTIRLIRFLMMGTLLFSGMAFAKFPLGDCDYDRCKSDPCEYCEECPMVYSFQEPYNSGWIEWTAFTGIDYDWNRVTAVRDWKKLLPGSAPGINFYVGGRVLRYVGLEVGYEAFLKRRQSLTFSVGDTYFGTPVTALTAGRVEHSLSLYGWYFDLKGYLPMENWLEVACIRCIDVVGTVGFGLIQPRVHVSSTALIFRRVGQATLDTEKKGVFRVGAGVECLVTDLLGIRAMFHWKRLSALSLRNHRFANVFPSFPIGEQDQAFRHSVGASLGLFITY